MNFKWFRLLFSPLNGNLKQICLRRTAPQSKTITKPARFVSTVQQQSKMEMLKRNAALLEEISRKTTFGVWNGLPSKMSEPALKMKLSTIMRSRPSSRCFIRSRGSTPRRQLRNFYLGQTSTTHRLSKKISTIERIHELHQEEQRVQRVQSDHGPGSAGGSGGGCFERPATRRTLMTPNTLNVPNTPNTANNIRNYATWRIPIIPMPKEMKKEPSTSSANMKLVRSTIQHAKADFSSKNQQLPQTLIEQQSRQFADRKTFEGWVTAASPNMEETVAGVRAKAVLSTQSSIGLKKSSKTFDLASDSVRKLPRPKSDESPRSQKDISIERIPSQTMGARTHEPKREPPPQTEYFLASNFGKTKVKIDLPSIPIDLNERNYQDQYLTNFTTAQTYQDYQTRLRRPTLVKTEEDYAKLMQSKKKLPVKRDAIIYGRGESEVSRMVIPPHILAGSDEPAFLWKPQLRNKESLGAMRKARDLANLGRLLEQNELKHAQAILHLDSKTHCETYKDPDYGHFSKPQYMCFSEIAKNENFFTVVPRSRQQLKITYPVALMNPSAFSGKALKGSKAMRSLQQTGGGCVLGQSTVIPMERHSVYESPCSPKSVRGAHSLLTPIYRKSSKEFTVTHNAKKPSTSSLESSFRARMKLRSYRLSQTRSFGSDSKLDLMSYLDGPVDTSQSSRKDNIDFQSRLNQCPTCGLFHSLSAEGKCPLSKLMRSGECSKKLNPIFRRTYSTCRPKKRYAPTTEDLLNVCKYCGFVHVHPGQICPMTEALKLFFTKKQKPPFRSVIAAQKVTKLKLPKKDVMLKRVDHIDDKLRLFKIIKRATSNPGKPGKPPCNVKCKSCKPKMIFRKPTGGVGEKNAGLRSVLKKYDKSRMSATWQTVSHGRKLKHEDILTFTNSFSGFIKDLVRSKENRKLGNVPDIHDDALLPKSCSPQVRSSSRHNCELTCTRNNSTTTRNNSVSGSRNFNTLCVNRAPRKGQDGSTTCKSPRTRDSGKSSVTEIVELTAVPKYTIPQITEKWSLYKQQQSKIYADKQANIFKVHTPAGKKSQPQERVPEQDIRDVRMRSCIESLRGEVNKAEKALKRGKTESNLKSKTRTEQRVSTIPMGRVAKSVVKAKSDMCMHPTPKAKRPQPQIQIPIDPTKKLCEFIDKPEKRVLKVILKEDPSTDWDISRMSGFTPERHVRTFATKEGRKPSPVEAFLMKAKTGPTKSSTEQRKSTEKCPPPSCLQCPSKNQVPSCNRKLCENEGLKETVTKLMRVENSCEMDLLQARMKKQHAKFEAASKEEEFYKFYRCDAHRTIALETCCVDEKDPCEDVCVPPSPKPPSPKKVCNGGSNGGSTNSCGMKECDVYSTDGGSGLRCLHAEKKKKDTCKTEKESYSCWAINKEEEKCKSKAKTKICLYDKKGPCSLEKEGYSSWAIDKDDERCKPKAKAKSMCIPEKKCMTEKEDYCSWAIDKDDDCPVVKPKKVSNCLDRSFKMSHCQECQSPTKPGRKDNPCKKEEKDKDKDQCCSGSKKGDKDRDQYCYGLKKGDKEKEQCCSGSKKGDKDRDQCYYGSKKGDKDKDQYCYGSKKSDKDKDQCYSGSKKGDKDRDQFYYGSKKGDKEKDQCCYGLNKRDKEKDQCCSGSKKNDKDKDQCCSDSKKGDKEKPQASCQNPKVQKYQFNKPQTDIVYELVTEDHRTDAMKEAERCLRLRCMKKFMQRKESEEAKDKKHDEDAFMEDMPKMALANDKYSYTPEKSEGRKTQVYDLEELERDPELVVKPRKEKKETKYDEIEEGPKETKPHKIEKEEREEKKSTSKYESYQKEKQKDLKSYRTEREEKKRDTRKETTPEEVTSSKYETHHKEVKMKTFMDDREEKKRTPEEVPVSKYEKHQKEAKTKAYMLEKEDKKRDDPEEYVSSKYPKYHREINLMAQAEEKEEKKYDVRHKSPPEDKYERHQKETKMKVHMLEKEDKKRDEPEEYRSSKYWKYHREIKLRTHADEKEEKKRDARHKSPPEDKVEKHQKEAKMKSYMLEKEDKKREEPEEYRSSKYSKYHREIKLKTQAEEKEEKKRDTRHKSPAEDKHEKHQKEVKVESVMKEIEAKKHDARDTKKAISEELSVSKKQARQKEAYLCKALLAEGSDSTFKKNLPLTTPTPKEDKEDNLLIKHDDANIESDKTSISLDKFPKVEHESEEEVEPVVKTDDSSPIASSESKKYEIEVGPVCHCHIKFMEDYDGDDKKAKDEIMAVSKELQKSMHHCYTKASLKARKGELLKCKACNLPSKAQDHDAKEDKKADKDDTQSEAPSQASKITKDAFRLGSIRSERYIISDRCLTRPKVLPKPDPRRTGDIAAGYRLRPAPKSHVLNTSAACKQDNISTNTKRTAGTSGTGSITSILTLPSTSRKDFSVEGSLSEFRKSLDERNCPHMMGLPTSTDIIADKMMQDLLKKSQAKSNLTGCLELPCAAEIRNSVRKITPEIEYAKISKEQMEVICEKVLQEIAMLRKQEAERKNAACSKSKPKPKSQESQGSPSSQGSHGTEVSLKEPSWKYIERPCYTYNKYEKYDKSGLPINKCMQEVRRCLDDYKKCLIDLRLMPYIDKHFDYDAIAVSTSTPDLAIGKPKLDNILEGEPVVSKSSSRMDSKKVEKSCSSNITSVPMLLPGQPALSSKTKRSTTSLFSQKSRSLTQHSTDLLRPTAQDCDKISNLQETVEVLTSPSKNTRRQSGPSQGHSKRDSNSSAGPGTVMNSQRKSLNTYAKNHGYNVTVPLNNAADVDELEEHLQKVADNAKVDEVTLYIPRRDGCINVQLLFQSKADASCPQESAKSGAETPVPVPVSETSAMPPVVVRGDPPAKVKAGSSFELPHFSDESEPRYSYTKLGASSVQDDSQQKPIQVFQQMYEMTTSKLKSMTSATNPAHAKITSLFKDPDNFWPIEHYPKAYSSCPKANQPQPPRPQSKGEDCACKTLERQKSLTNIFRTACAEIKKSSERACRDLRNAYNAQRRK